MTDIVQSPNDELKAFDLAEFKKNFDDKWWRLNNLYWIVDKQGRKIKFKPNEIQTLMYWNGTGRDVWLKARQQTISSFIIISRLDDCLFRKNWKHRTIADNEENLTKLFRLAKYAYDNLDRRIKLRMPLTSDNSKEMIFGHNDSHFMITLEVHSEPARSLHFSEVSFMKDDEKIQESLESVPIDGDTFIDFESISNGAGNYFHDKYKEAKKGKGNYKAHFFPWFAFKEYQIYLTEAEKQIIIQTLSDREKLLIEKFELSYEQIKFRRHKISDFKGSDMEAKERKFLIKYPEDDVECFNITGNNIFNTRLINFYRQNRLLAPIERKEIFGDGSIHTSLKGELEIFEIPMPGQEYVLGGDVAKGSADGDYSSMYVLKKKTGQPVAKYKKHISPALFGIACVAVAILYNRALVAIEKNDRGHAAILAARTFGKMYGFYRFYYMGMENPNQSIKILEYGFHTNTQTKAKFISMFAEEFEGGCFILLDDELLAEMETYIETVTKKGNLSYNAAEGYHDDLIIAFAIALLMCMIFVYNKKKDPKKETISADGYEAQLKEAIKKKELMKRHESHFSCIM